MTDTINREKCPWCGAELKPGHTKVFDCGSWYLMNLTIPIRSRDCVSRAPNATLTTLKDNP